MDNFANAFSTVLSSAVDNVTTSFPVASVTGAPACPFRAIVNGEIVIATGLATLTYTVTRGAEGTTAAAHSSGAAFTHIVTAAALASFVQNPMSAQDDLIVGGSSGAPARLAKGSSGQVLTVEQHQRARRLGYPFSFWHVQPDERGRRPDHRRGQWRAGKASHRRGRQSLDGQRRRYRTGVGYARVRRHEQPDDAR